MIEDLLQAIEDSRKLTERMCRDAMPRWISRACQCDGCMPSGPFASIVTGSLENETRRAAESRVALVR